MLGSRKPAICKTDETLTYLNACFADCLLKVASHPPNRHGELSPALTGTQPTSGHGELSPAPTGTQTTIAAADRRCCVERNMKTHGDPQPSKLDSLGSCTFLQLNCMVGGSPS